MQNIFTSGGHFVHRLNPVFLQVGNIQLRYYGLAYAIGFAGIYFWLRNRQKDLGWSTEEVYDLSLLISLGALIMGHLFEIIFYEWTYYKESPLEALMFWRGGMASHGVLLGGALGMWLFCKIRKRSFLMVGDQIAIPVALFMGIGRIGNFINGENFGPVTDVWWGVKFPYADGFRHPVDIYDGLKNFVVFGILLLIQKRCRHHDGRLFGHLLFWYGFLRFLVDFFREYGVYFWGFGRGQYFNLAMATMGLFLIWRSYRSSDIQLLKSPGITQPHAGVSWPKKFAFLFLLLFCLTIPSGWSQGWLQQLKVEANRHL